MLDLFKDYHEDHLPQVSEDELTDEQVIEEIHSLKEKLADDVMVLGHHYQQDDVIQFADITGDSLALAKEAAKTQKPYTIFCGVHFMAETADMLTAGDQQVILPDLKAGCSMADMANREQIDKAWSLLSEWTDETIVPVTYINCSALLKSFVGEKGGSICTSSNARKIIEWALDQGDKLMFFPDQHLGRNTCYDMGISRDEMVVYNPNYYRGGLTAEEVQKAKVILWYGYCSVHQGFTAEQVKSIQQKDPETCVIVHPECPFEVVGQADMSGSTAKIIQTIDNAPAGSKFAVGTEINLVNRLSANYANKQITSLSPYQCLCTTMYRVRPRWLLASFRAIDRGEPINVISVPADVRTNAMKALNCMLSL